MTRAKILELIPHAGAMCLLDEVVAWDSASILCRSNTHRDNHHPLRNHGHLAAVHLVEYAAQAVAVHGGLLARDSGTPALKAGRLAGLRDIKFNAGRDIQGIDSALDIAAHSELAGTSGLIYRFTVSGDQATLASGRLTIVSG